MSKYASPDEDSPWDRAAEHVESRYYCCNGDGCGCGGITVEQAAADAEADDLATKRERACLDRLAALSAEVAQPFAMSYLKTLRGVSDEAMRIIWRRAWYAGHVAGIEEASER